MSAARLAAAPRPLVLVADDDDNLREAIVDVLEIHDSWEILQASDGESALAVALAERPDAIILDQRMPGLQGTDVVQRLRASGLKAPVILVTAGDDVARLAHELDLCCYLGKPFNVAELIRLVNRAIAGEC